MAATLDLRTYVKLEQALVNRLLKDWRVRSAPIYEAIAVACREQRWDEARRRVPELTMAPTGTENREWIKYLLLSCATFGAGQVAKQQPSFVGIGTFDTTLDQVTKNVLTYLELDATATVQEQALQLIAEDEAAAWPKVAYDPQQPRDEKGRWSRTAAGLPADLPLHPLSAASIEEALHERRWNLQAHPSKYHEGSYDLQIAPTVGEGIAVVPSKYGGALYVDTRLATVTEDGEVTPKLDDGWSDEIPAPTDSGDFFRGMRYEEYQSILATGQMGSTGDYNLGDEQKGLTFFSTDPEQAAHYSAGFAPWQHAPTFDSPAIVVRIKDPGTAVPNLPGLGRDTTERGVPGAVPERAITEIYVGRPYRIKPGEVELYKDWDRKTGKPTYTEGSRQSPSSWVVWKKYTPEEFRALTQKYDPQQPRDAHGRWVDEDHVTHVGDFVELYHGTSKRRANKILKEGLQIRAVAKQTMGGDPESSRNYVWMAKRVEAAQSYSEMHQHPTVLKILLPTAIYERLKPRFSGPVSVWSPEAIPPTHISVLTERVEKREGIGGIARKFDESQHPRGEDGRFIEATQPRIFNRMEDVVEYSGGWANEPKRWAWRITPEDAARYGGDAKVGAASGKLLTGEPIPREQLPPTLYHVTTNLPAVERSGVLLGLLESGGLGGGQAQGVSFTTSKDDAVVIQRELRRAVQIARGEATIEDIEKWARADEKEAGLPEGALKHAVDFAREGWEGNKFTIAHDYEPGKGWTVPRTPEDRERVRRSVLKDALNAYLQSREETAARALGQTSYPYSVPILKNPILFGQQEHLAKIRPEDVGTLEIPSEQIPEGALVTTGSDKFLHEVRAYSDVPLRRKKVAFDPHQLRDDHGRFTFMHGTMENRLANILREGLRTSHAGSVWPNFSHHGEVYVTTDEDGAKHWAESAAEAKHGQRLYDWREAKEQHPDLPKPAYPGAAVLTIQIPEAEISRLMEDENFKGEGDKFQFQGDIPPEWIVKVQVLKSTETDDDFWEGDRWKTVPLTQLKKQPKVAGDGRTLYLALVLEPDPSLPTVQKFDESKHPRDPKGTSTGGQFTTAPAVASDPRLQKEAETGKVAVERLIPQAIQTADWSETHMLDAMAHTWADMAPEVQAKVKEKYVDAEGEAQGVYAEAGLGAQRIARREARFDAMTEDEKFLLADRYQIYPAKAVVREADYLPRRWRTGVEPSVIDYSDPDNVPEGDEGRDLYYASDDYKRTHALANQLTVLRMDEIRAERQIDALEPKLTYTIRESNVHTLQRPAYVAETPDGRIIAASNTPELAKAQADRWVEEQSEPIPSEGLIQNIWEAWKRKSSEGLGLSLQLAAAQELGGHHRMTPEEVEQAEYHAEQFGGKRGMPLLRAYVRAQWEVTQYVMAQAGESQVSVYRGLMIDGAKVKATPHQYVDLQGQPLPPPSNIESHPEGEKTKQGNTVLRPYVRFQFNGEQFVVEKDRRPPQSILEVGATPWESDAQAIQRRLDRYMKTDQAKAFTKLPEIVLQRAGAQSTTGDRSVANTWEGVGVPISDPTRVVLRIAAPATSVLSLPVYGENKQHEYETVVLGTTDRWAWDAWRDLAPSTGAQPVVKKAEPKPLVIDLQAEDRGKPHWLSTVKPPQKG